MVLTGRIRWSHSPLPHEKLFSGTVKNLWPSSSNKGVRKSSECDSKSRLLQPHLTCCHMALQHNRICNCFNVRFFFSHKWFLWRGNARGSQFEGSPWRLSRTYKLLSSDLYSSVRCKNCSLFFLLKSWMLEEVWDHS